jgi:F0F1-type ATP synthase assembly protein I
MRALALPVILANLARMKLLLSVLAYLLISAILGWGILQAVKGNPWLLIVGFLAYAVAFAKIGCLPKSH